MGDCSFDESDYQRLLSSTPNALSEYLTKVEYFGQRSYLRRHQIVNDDFQPALRSMLDLLTSDGAVLGDLHFKAGVGSMLSLVDHHDLDWLRASRVMVSPKRFAI